MSIPKITVQGWHHDGPVYRIHRKLTGWRNRKARRAGADPFDQVGHPGGRNVAEPASFLVFAHGDVEVYAFNRGHVYLVEQLADGNNGAILVDAREDYALITYKDGLEFLAARGLTDDELAEILEQGAEGEPGQVPAEPLEQPSNVSDGAESQEPAPDLEAALQTPAVPEDVENVSPSGQIGVIDLGGDVPPTPDPNAAPAEPDPVVEPQAAEQPEQPELTDAEVDAIDTAEDEAIEDARDERAELQQLASKLGVQLEELEALSPEERAELAAEGSTEPTTPEGTPDGAGEPAEDTAASDDEDASEGDDEDAADEEE